MENNYPGFQKFFECFSQFQDKLNIDYLSERDFDKLSYLDSDSDSDFDIDSDSDESGIDSDDIVTMFGNGDESETDSDSDEYVKVIDEFLNMI